MRKIIFLFLLLHVAFLYGESNLAEIKDSLVVKPEKSEFSPDTNHSTNKFTAFFFNKGTKNYQNRANIGAYVDFNWKFSIKDDDNLDYPQDIYSDEFLVFNNNHNYKLGTYASYKLSSYITDNLLLEFNFDLISKYHDIVSRQDVGLYELRKRVWSKRSILSLDPGIKYSGRDLTRFGSAFISVGLPVSLIQASERYEYRHYYNILYDIVKYSYRKEHIDLDLAMDAEIGIESMVKYISRQTMWNKFKQGHSLSFNFNSNIVSKDSLNTNFYFQ